MSINKMRNKNPLLLEYNIARGARNIEERMRHFVGSTISHISKKETPHFESVPSKKHSLFKPFFNLVIRAVNKMVW